MAHFAKINDNNVVEQVVVVNNEVLLNNGAESEQKGIDFLKSLYGQDTNWKQTSYNGNFRQNFAGVGGTYDPVNDAFILPKPYPSWILVNFKWESPIAYPITFNQNLGTNSDGEQISDKYEWNEEIQNWQLKN